MDIQRPFHSHFYLYDGSDQCLYSNISIITDLLCRYILRVTSCIVRSDIIFALVVVLYFLVYQRVFPETRIYLMMVPIFFYFQLPACLPIFVGMFCGIAGLPAILMGTVIYYMSNILQQTMNQLASGSAHGKVYSLIAARAIDNKDLLLYFVVFCLVTALVTAIRKRGVAHGWNISILAGGVVYLICMFIGGYLVNNEINITSQIGTIIGSIAIALIIQFYTM